jgi:DNA modification methylase
MMFSDKMNGKLYVGDNLEHIRKLPDNSVDAVVTDPPYGLGKEPDPRAVLRDWLVKKEFRAGGSGFMGREWDAFVPSPVLWMECYRVLKPGGHLLSFAGTRTYDWVVMGLRLAGFEIRDQIMWIFGSGFPKSLNVSKAIDRAAGAERKIVGTYDPRSKFDGKDRKSKAISERWRQYEGRDDEEDRMDWSSAPITAPATQAARQWDGWHTALKPAHEPVVLARKPLDGTVADNVQAHGTGAINVDGCRVGTVKNVPASPRRAKQGTAYGDLSKCPPDSSGGRWPANIMHDGSAEVLAGFPMTGKSSGGRIGSAGGGAVDYAGSSFVKGDPGFGDTGSAARFFYSPKASRAEREAGLESLSKSVIDPSREQGSAGRDNPRAGAGRNGEARANIHPTVKPLNLMRYMVKMVTPPGGTVLDPYAGSGTTLIAAQVEGFRWIGMELETNHAVIAYSRVSHWSDNPPEDAKPLQPPHQRSEPKAPVKKRLKKVAARKSKSKVVLSTKPVEGGD